MTHGGLATSSALCPYQGLAPYEERNSELFFGRARATRDLLERLGRRTGSVLMVSGASGVGKSSLLRAGVLPALADGGLPGSQRWTRTVVTPGPVPLRALTRARVEAASQKAESQQVLLVDQFEELFTLTGDERVRQECVQLLHEAAADGVAVIIGVRSDYWERCAAYPQFAEAIMDGQVIVEPMTGTDMRLAITGPAAAAGLEVEPGLVDTILGELRSDASGRYEPGALPLLSQALRNTWERREGDLLTLRGYEESGRVDGAVRHTTDAVFEALSRDDRTTALRAFRRMTVIASGARIARRPATRAEIHAATSAKTPEKEANVDAMLSAFADRRLLTLDANDVQIAHDTLLTTWPALRLWIEPDVEALGVYDRLIADATEWNDNHRDAAYLYRGARLLAVDDSRPRWERDPESFPPPGPVAESFVAASQAAARRAGRTRRLVTGGLALLTVLAVAGAGLAVNAAADARDQRTLAVSRQLAAESEVTADPLLAAQLAIAAWRIAPTEEARYRLLQTAAQPGRAALAGHTSGLSELAVSGSMAATTSGDRTVRLWDVRTHDPLGAPIRPAARDCPGDADTRAVAFAPGGKVVAASCEGTIALWDVATRRPTGQRLRTDERVDGMAFSPDGRLLATGDGDGAVQLWDLRTGRAETLGHHGRAREKGYDEDRFKPFNRHPTESGVNAVVFSPDGERVATAGKDDVVRMWNVADRTEERPLKGHGDDVEDVAFSPDGTSLATAGQDGTARLWNLKDRRETGKLREKDGILQSVAFSPDGTRLATTETGGALRLWDLRSREQVGSALLDQAEIIREVAYSPDGQLVATGSDNRLHFADPRPFRQVGSPLPGERAVAMSPDGRTLAALGDGPEILLWDVATRRETRRIKADKSIAISPRISFGRDGRTVTVSHTLGTGVWNVADGRLISRTEKKLKPREIKLPGGRKLVVPGGLPMFGPSRDVTATSPDRRTIATTSNQNTVRLLNANPRRQIGELTGHTERVTAIAFSPDGAYIATGSDDDSVRLWDLRTRRPIGDPLTGHGANVTGLAFARDGRTLASVGADKTVRLWNVGLPADLAAAACANAGRPLTQEEWARYLPGEDYQRICG